MRNRMYETSTSVSVFFPPTSSPMPGRGVPIGNDFEGGVFRYDPFRLYEDGYLTNLNMVVVGQIGRGKSALVKSLLYRQYLSGHEFFVLDPKGEYEGLCKLTGARRIQPSARTRLGLNPFPGYDAALEPAANLARLVLASYDLVEAVIARRLDPIERHFVDQSIRSSIQRRGLVDVVELHRGLLESPESYSTLEVGVRLGLAAEVRRLIDGDLAGLVASDGDSLFDTGSMVVDLSSLVGTAALGITVNLLLSHRQSLLAGRGAKGSYFVLDEAWALLKGATVVDWFASLWKLSRSHGIANIAVQHRLSDLSRVGAESSAGLALDSETFVVYAQPASESEAMRRFLAIPHPVASSLPRLRKGVALWKVGDRLSMVAHRLHPSEQPITDTDGAIRTSAKFSTRTEVS